MLDAAIVLVAAGSSSRMGFPKLWTPIQGQPLLAYALSEALAARPRELIVVVPAERVTAATKLLESLPARRRAAAVTSTAAPRVVAGGARRRDSVLAGLNASTATWLAVHDAARAFTPSEVFARGLAAASVTGAAVPGIPLKDTIKQVANARVVATPARAEHVAVQTPQVFRRDILQVALARTDDDVTDEAALVEALGIGVAVFDGDDRAFKVTTPLDFALAQSVLARSAAAEPAHETR